MKSWNWAAHWSFYLAWGLANKSMIYPRVQFLMKVSTVCSFIILQYIQGGRGACPWNTGS